MSSEMMWKLVPVDDPARSYSDPGFPDEMVWAGIEAMERAEDDLKRNTGPDWDTGMICVAVYRAMTATAPEPPAPAGEVVAWTSVRGLRKLQLGSPTAVEPASNLRDGVDIPLYTAPPTVAPDAVRRAALEEAADTLDAIWAAYQKSSDVVFELDMKDAAEKSRAIGCIADVVAECAQSIRALATQPAPDGRG